ncbi:TPA: hypothetical protein ACKFMW_002398 [Enterobacter hormaechei]|uniref:Uncharacterized protein n=2 Tax=Enterobacter cloacae TaxID=550 RepID=A0A0M7IS99_ENTCL|nr:MULTISPECIES: hypothetical protein [Enterobacteriaceae]EIM33981.1 hypothetical protein PGS1_23068 [Enterobacter cloacae subsp. cloacae GS1]ADF63745.1 hypothetical protein ECL_04212 [Enterobacter cloacae subsp. cloacae ATCC 13047]EHN8818220.1 hypothetical protein [Enterobacter hormaechei]EIZ9235985.1 hypothetical protein [Cronobacter sakazakii]EJG0743415.1 hypothetical protein [Cronobacter sakazakii]
MAIGNRQIQEESLKEELDRLLEELEITQEQREFIESMRQEDGENNNGK